MLSIRSTNLRFFSGSLVLLRSPEKPTMAFRGVRISWLMFARNADFMRSDSCAWERASISSCSCSFRSVITSSEPEIMEGFPVSSLSVMMAFISNHSVLLPKALSTRNSVDT